MRKFSLLVLLLSLFSPSSVLAQGSEKFITIVNPVRISSYTKRPAESLKSEYAVVRQRSLPATWLLTYDALINQSINSVIKNMDKKQEFGVFLEVTPIFAKEAWKLPPSLPRKRKLSTTIRVFGIMRQVFFFPAIPKTKEDR